VSTTAAPYQDYPSTSIPMDQTSGPLQELDSGPSHSAQMSTIHAGLVAYDDSPLAVQFSSSYSALQSTHVLGVQPSSNGQEMVYPDDFLQNQYLARASPPTNVVGLNIKGDPETSRPLTHGHNSAMMPAPPVKVESPVIHRQASAVDMVPQYDPPYGCGASNAPMDSDQQAMDMPRAGTDGPYPHARTTKRGPFRDHDERLATAYTRRIGSCIRCRMQRIRVRSESSTQCCTMGGNSLTHCL
jgi:hypothetical protein